jgi:hypothetical protein
VDYSPQAKKDLRKIEELGLEKLPVCIAKTQKSLSDNPALLGRPKDFIITVREIEIAAGAGFLIPITGNIMRMPGLPAHPASENISIDNRRQHHRSFIIYTYLVCMKSILKGKNSEVIIDTEGPVVIIGESINPTRRKKLVETLSQHDFSLAIQLAQSQIRNGADVLDVNVGYPGVDDATLLPLTVKAIQEAVDVPLCLDSPNPKAIEAALKVFSGKALINSVNGEEHSLQALLPVAKEYDAAVIGLVMDDDGITQDPEKRFAIAEKILNRAIKAGHPPGGRDH